MRATVVGFVTLLATLVFYSAGLAASPPASAVPVTVGALWEMYAGKTQVWPPNKGGWYFARDRLLAGYSTKGSFAAGRWWIKETGEVCVQAKWIWAKGAKGRGPSEKTCWYHLQSGNRIWKRAGDGGWYEWNKADGESHNFITGYKYHSEVEELRKQYGL